MAYAKASQISEDAIPVVDLGPLRDGSNPVAIAKALHRASQSLGFIYVSNHGIDPALIENARQCAYQFFRSSEAEKSTVTVSQNHRGWLKPGQSKMQDDAKADLKESFIWGMQNSRGLAPNDHPLRGDNQWPNFLPELQSVSMAYFEAAHGVAHHLMRGFALGLNLNPEFFLRSVEAPLSRASYVYYPAQDESLGEDQFGVAPHTDFGVLTVLCQDDVGGLQVQGIDGEWLLAPPIDGTLVVNVADLLSRWTNGAYKSTPHRVVNTSGRERLSLVLAFDPDPETLVDSRAVFGVDHEPDNDPITCGDYLVWRFGKAFAYRNTDGPVQ